MNRSVLVVLVICLTIVFAGVSFADEPLNSPDSGSLSDILGLDDGQEPAKAPSEAVLMPEIQPVPAISVAEDYLLMEEDVLKMDVWGEPYLSNMQMQITPDGKISIPYVGEIKAAGLTVGDLRSEIIQRFEDADILGNPRITITLLNMHQLMVRVLGEVRQPGLVVFKEGDTVLDAIAQAGSYTENAWLEKATLTRRGDQEPIAINIRDMLEGDHTNNIKLKKGDIISIPPEDYENKIYVMGQVMRPSMYDLKDNTTLLAAINLAGGPTERASLGNTKVIRGDPQNPETVPCDLAKLLGSGDRTQDIVLRPGDVVMVPETKQPNWTKWSQIIGTILNLTYLRKMGF